MNTNTNTINYLKYSDFEKKDLSKLIGFLSLLYPTQSIESITANVNRPSENKIYIASFSNEIIGTCWCLPLKFDKYYIGGVGGVAVSKEFQHKGIGFKLVSYLIENETDFDTFLLWTRVPAFFEKLGFFDFSKGIKTIEGDSTPMLKTENNYLRFNFPVTKWERIKF
ncbi:GNAT family N-acetyltransferase [Candidatus Dependentiae bacterium]|nr:GNAT family N-acetyltransferase [Candidatus Dependentiae bacterium]